MAETTEPKLEEKKAKTAEPAVAETKEAKAPEKEAESAPAAPKKRKKAKRNVREGQIHVLASFNNTIITVTDSKGNTLTKASSGASGFRGSKKGTAYAAQIAAEKAVSTAKQSYGLAKADVYVRGVGMGRDAAIRTLINQRVEIENIKDVTGIPHGGVRPRRPKRN